jgi:hypothetical protein
MAVAHFDLPPTRSVRSRQECYQQLCPAVRTLKQRILKVTARGDRAVRVSNRDGPVPMHLDPFLRAALSFRRLRSERCGTERHEH